jgi:hypothetical protein
MLLLASRNFPSRLTADYGSFNPGLANEAPSSTERSSTASP